MEEGIIENVPLREQVADIIRRMIIRGELAGGQKISERQISEMLGVSTTPVKEAFRALQAEGLVTSIPRKGSYVSQFSLGHLVQLAYMRASLEGVAAHFAVGNATDGDISLMEDALDRSARLTQQGAKSTEVSQENSRFHQVLRDACKNSYLSGLIANMRSIENSIRQMALGAEVDEQLRGQQEHRAILAAVKARDAALAERLMTEHIRRSADFVLQKRG